MPKDAPLLPLLLICLTLLTLLSNFHLLKLYPEHLKLVLLGLWHIYRSLRQISPFFTAPWANSFRTFSFWPPPGLHEQSGRQPLAASRSTLDVEASDSVGKTKNARPSKNTFEDILHVNSQREAGRGQPTLCYCSQSHQEIQFCLCSKPTANCCCIHLGHQIKLL